MFKKRLKKPIFPLLLAALFLTLGACSNANEETAEKKKLLSQTKTHIVLTLI